MAPKAMLETHAHVLKADEIKAACLRSQTSWYPLPVGIVCLLITCAYTHVYIYIYIYKDSKIAHFRARIYFLKVSTVPCDMDEKKSNLEPQEKETLTNGKDAQAVQTGEQGEWGTATRNKCSSLRNLFGIKPNVFTIKQWLKTLAFTNQ